MNRKIVNTLLLLFFAFTLYNTLIPFNFHFDTTVFQNLLKIGQGPGLLYRFATNSKTDIAGNIILFMPLGFLLYLWRCQRKLHAPIVYSVIIGFIFSLLIEFIQLFFKDRISSPIDLINNTLGTGIGAFCAHVYMRIFADRITKMTGNILREQPLTLILIVFLILHILSALFPFNVGITISELLSGLKQTNIIPFQNHSLSLLILNQPARFDGNPFNWLKFIESLLLWICWGYLIRVCYTLYWKYSGAGMWPALAAVFLPALITEFCQVFIVSRFCNINDIISSWMGAFLGIIIAAAFIRNKKTALADGIAHLKPLMLIYLIFIFFTGMRPFDFSFPETGFLPQLNPSHWIPFLAYFQNTSIWNIDDVIKTLLYFTPIGLYLSFRLFEALYSWKHIYIYSGLLGLISGSLIEFMQMFSPSRSADITDAILFCTGGLIGAFSLYYYSHEIKPALHTT